LALFVVLLAAPPALRPAAAQGDAASAGLWSPPIQWPVIAVNLVMLPTGKVIFWQRGGDISSWDSATGAIGSATYSGYNIFCTGHAQLADGRILDAGGHIVDGQGLPYASIYNPVTNSWTRLPNMNAGRWYPACLTLGDGSVAVLSGSMSSEYNINDLPQVWDGNGAWRDLTSARATISLYPMLFLAPNGQVFNPGPNTVTRYLNTAGTGAWTTVAARSLYRDYGSAVLYDNGKVLVVGGSDPPSRTGEVIDLNAPSPSWRTIASMTFARRQCSATLLADGKVLVTGGVSGQGFNNRDNPVYAAELWDPVTETWSVMASMTQPRWYHSTAVLLPDGSVLTAGGDDTPTAQIFSPPYLFKGARPSISSAPSSAGYGGTFFVGTPAPNSITNVNLVRLGSATHTVNMDQRFNRLNFTRVSGGLSVTAPANGNQAPPGYYMLFLINSSGVPSVSQMIKIGGTAPTAPAPPSNLLVTGTAADQVGLAWTDAASNEDGFTVERSTDGANFAPVGSVGANVTSYSSTGLSPGTAYWFRVRSYQGSNTSAYSNTATATTTALPGGVPPAAPSNLQAVTVSSSQINLTWTDNSNDEQGFAIERAKDGEPWSQVATVGANVTSYASGNLEASTTYWFRVRSFKSGDFSEYSNAVARATDPAGTDPVPPPPAPGSLVATTASSSQINLSWSDNSSDEDGFAVERSTDGANFAQIGTLAANIKSYNSTGLNASTAYWFRVRAFRAALYSGYSNTANATTSAPPPTPPPSAPSNLRATTASSSQINLAWNDNSGDEDGFKIERSTDGANFGQLTTVGANVTSYASGGLNASTTYWYRVRAYRGSSDSGYSNTANAATAAPPGNTPPSAPANLKAVTASFSQINLSWTDTSNNEQGFAIERAKDGQAFSQVATVSANVTSYNSGGLEASTTYWFRVRAYTGTDVSEYSNAVPAATDPKPADPPPPAPGSLSASAVSASRIDLSWTDSGGTRDGFKIERSSDGVNYSPIGTVSAGVTSYASTSLSPATTYYYRVYAYGSAGNSDYSNRAQATTASAAPVGPTPPSNLVATTFNATQIVLSWADNSANETRFLIERSSDGVNWSPLATVNANVTTFADGATTPLTPSTRYYYRVYAQSASGSSAFSNTANATTAAPGGRYQPPGG
jgi:hypothetical protein